MQKLADLALKEASGDVHAAVVSAYQRTLGRKPSGAELDYALTYIENDPVRMKELAWLLFNLDEFIDRATPQDLVAAIAERLTEIEIELDTEKAELGAQIRELLDALLDRAA